MDNHKKQIIQDLLGFYKDIEPESSEEPFMATEDGNPITVYYNPYKGVWGVSKKEAILGYVLKDISDIHRGRKGI